MKIYGKWMVLILSICLFSSAMGEDIITTLAFSRSDVSLYKKDGYDVVALTGCTHLHRVGEPMLPVKTVHVAIPRGMVLKDVVVTHKIKKEIPGSFLIYPAQPQFPISQPNDWYFVEPSLSIYQSSESYPKPIVKISTQGYLSGHAIATLSVYPVQYLPSQRRLFYYPELELNLVLERSITPPTISIRSVKAERDLKEALKNSVINPADVEDFVAERVVDSSPLQHRFLEYVIITKNYYFDEFEPLVEWKTRRGVSTVLRDIDWILANYSGHDPPEILRNYIKTIFADSGTVWLLLGGDVSDIPYRGAYCHAGDAEDYLPCDSYYANLDGNWDANGNHIYGEFDDDVDFYPDLWIGRATVDSDVEVSRFINKVLTYEQNPPEDYQRKALFFTAHLDETTDPRELKELIDNAHLPSYYDVDYLSDEASDVVRDSLNIGYNISNHDGHGNTYSMYTDWTSDYLTSSDMNGLTNFPRHTGVLYTIGCYCGAFDYSDPSDCIGERFFGAANGGGYFVGNSRYGWYRPGHPTEGSSAEFDRVFFKSLFDRGMWHVGHTLGYSKFELASIASEDAYSRWVYYELNLLGDPETPIWTDLPSPLEVVHPDSVQLDASFVVVVRSDGEPVVNAMVCLWKDNDVYLRRFTNTNGETTVDFSCSSPGTLWITVVKQNYIPYQGSIDVFDHQTVADTIIVESATASPGQTGKVINIWGIKSDSLSGYTLAMYFDPAVLEIDTITLEGTCGEDAVFFDWGDTLNYVTGVVVKTWFPPPPYIPPGKDLLFNLVVNVSPGAPQGPTWLNLENDVGGVLESDNYFTTWNLGRIDPLLIDGILTIGEPSDFIRGDVNGSGELTMSDGLLCLRCQFVPGWPDSCECDDAIDANDNGSNTMGDCIRILRKLFVPGWQDSIPPPCCHAPLDCGGDPTSDDLGCESHPCSQMRSRSTHFENR